MFQDFIKIVHYKFLALIYKASYFQSISHTDVLKVY
jgi:hypothetical protein